MSADVDQLQRKWKELVAGNRMRCSFPAFNWNKDGVQFEAGNPLSSSSGAHFFQARLSEKTKTDQAHEVGDRAVNHQRQIRTSTTLRNNTGSICLKCYIYNTVYHLRGLERLPGLITFFPGKGEGGIRERGSNRFMVAKATRVSLDWCRLRIVPPGRDERASEYHFRTILLPPKWSRLPELIPNPEMIPS